MDVGDLPANDAADEATGRGLGQVIELHSSATYHVYMLGFLPGLAYLGDLPQKLMLPRRTTPRPRIAAGSLGMAAKMTCIFPMATPCGLHLIGRSPVPFWERRPEIKTLLAPGDRVTFSPVSLSEFEELSAKAAAGALHVEPVEETMEVAA